MRTVKLRVAFPPDGSHRGYDILIRDGILDELGRGAIPLPQASSFFIVTDSNVGRIYADGLRAGLFHFNRKVEIVTFPAGEANKNIRTAWTVASRLAESGADRRCVLLALGGGVVGDVTGFVASIYKRGVNYIHVPTTLLAQVDSSIGGKTGVNAPWGKNQLGTFHQPRVVLTDPLTLKTLPRRELLNGLAEIAKCAVVADRALFNRLASFAEYDSDIPRDIIAAACRIKAEIVSKDEKESNFRAVLNYGHTVGHAIESASNYRLSHGVCVILGMLAEGWIALRLGIFQERDFEEQSNLLRRLSGNVIKPSVPNKRTLLKFAAADKKASSSELRMSLPERLGKMHTTGEGNYTVSVPKAAFEESIDYLRGILRSS